jgi:hypothetical protein
MNKIITATVIIMLACSIGLLMCPTTVQANPAIIISQYTLSPEILSPGDSAILTLQIRNGDMAGAQSTTTVGGGGDTTTTTHTLATSIYGISIIPVQSSGRQIRAAQSYEDLGYLSAGASMEVNFKLLVDRNMSEGVYFPLVDIDVGTGTDIQYPLLVKVSNSSVTLLPTSIPSKISRGGTTELTVTAVNTRENAVNEVIITPQGEGIEFIPQSLFLGSLASEASTKVVFSIKPSEMGTSTLSFTLSYKNGDNLHSTTMVTPITVIDVLDVAPIITGFPMSIMKGSSSRITIEVYNAKTEKISGVLITPICDTTVIPSQYFIGSMDPDDVFSASFDIYANSEGLGSHTISFKVSFKQGNDYYETPLVSKTFDIVSGPGVSYLASGSSNSQSSTSAAPGAPSLVTCVLSFIIIIVVIVVLVLFYMRWRKRRQAS